MNDARTDEPANLLTAVLAALIADRLAGMDDDEWRYRAALASTAHDLGDENAMRPTVRIADGVVTVEWPIGEPLMTLAHEDLRAAVHRHRQQRHAQDGAQDAQDGAQDAQDGPG